MNKLSEKSSLGKSAAYLVASQAMALVVNMAIGILLSRYRTLLEYGTFSQINLIVSLVISLFMLGLPNSINYFIAGSDNKAQRCSFLSNYYSLSTLLSIFTGVVLLIFLPVIEIYFSNPLLKSFGYAILLFPWIRITSGSIENVLVVYNKSSALAVFRIVHSLVMLGVILFVRWMDWRFSQYMIMYVLLECGFALSVYFIIYRIEKGIHFEIDMSVIKRIFIYSVPIGLSVIVGTLNIEMDKLLIGKMLGTEMLAIYTNSGREFPVTILATALTAVLLPHLVRIMKQGMFEKGVELWGDTIELSYIIICFFATSLIVFAPQVISLLYSEKYLPGVDIFRIYSLVLLFRVTYFGILLNSVGKTKFILLSAVLSLVINAILNVVLYYMIGFSGPAWATLMSVLCVDLLQLFISARLVKIPFIKIFPWSKLLKVTLINGIWGVSAYSIISLLQLQTASNDIIVTIIFGFVCLVVYALYMYPTCIKKWKSINQEHSFVG